VGTDLLSFRKDIYGQSRTDLALTRTNHTNIGGYGQIATISYTMKDDISGKDLINLPLTLGFDRVRMITNAEHLKPIFSDNILELRVYQEVGIGEAGKMQVQVYPNPANSTLFVKADKVALKDMKILNLLGQQQQNITGKLAGTNNIDISQLGAGTYFLQLTGENGESATVRFTIAR
jgi:hypothetical protein